MTNAVTLTALGAIVGMYAWLLAPQLDKPYVYDDVNFILGADAIARTGLPFGNQGYLLHLTHEREQWALWHPPLYLYLLGMVTRLFGPGEVAARSLGVACQLGCAVIAFDLARRSLPESARTGRVARLAGVLAVALFLLSPLTVQAALVLDIDNTVLMTLIASIVWLAVREPGPWGPRTIIGMAALYTLALWAKLTTPLILLMALTFTRLFQEVGPRGARDALFVGVAGWLAFLLTWVGVTTLTGMPLDYTFIVIYREAMESGTSTADRLVSLPAFVAGAAPAWLWIGPYFCLLFVWTGVPRLWSIARRRGLCASDLVVVLGAAIYLAYIMKLAGNLPKYHAAMLPLWAAACGALVARCVGRPSVWQLVILAAGTLVSGWWLALRIGAVWEIQLTPELTKLGIVVPTIIGIAVAGLWAQIGRSPILRSIPVALTMVNLAWALGLNLHQRELEGSTTYYYGRYGQVEAARALSARLRPDELYIASKEVAWYASQQRYVDQESWHHHVWGLREEFDGRWLGQEIRLIALEIEETTVRGSYLGLLQPMYAVVGQYGNFIVLERRA